MNTVPIGNYRSPSQIARVLTESWLGQNAFCPRCGSKLGQMPNNTRALDFICDGCRSGFELKSRNGRFGSVIPDGAYKTMIKAIRSGSHPNLFLMSYRLPFEVTDLSALPKRFLVEQIVLERKPLSETARRAGWVGCNLNLGLVPKSALITYLSNGQASPKAQILELWKRSAVLEDVASDSRGWLTLTLGIVERLNKNEFTLADVYKHEETLSRLFPNNKNVRAKIRQQLQLLRDMNFITFMGAGKYAINI